ncbi:MAG: tetratricopeptide repeat protein [Nannocystaceae bacterium]
MGQSFAAALEAARATPESMEAWDHLEDLADSLDRPDEVGAAYRDMLAANIPTDTWKALAERAARFHDEWFGDRPDEMLGVLRPIFDKDPSATWAFEKLLVVLTNAERWDDLLDQYDHALQHTREPKARARLLDDAAHTAKDFAKRPGRAVDYLQMRLELDPTNMKLARNIERLLERGNRWEDLVELWHNRLPELPAPDARKARLRIAQISLDHLEAAGPALEELRTLVEESPGHPEACAELEKLLRGEEHSPGARLGALGLLRTNYKVADRPEALVDAVLAALTFAQGPDRIALRREAGSALAILGRDADALEHYAQLLAQEPSDADARRQLRELALRSGLHGEHAQALVSAAAQAEPSQAAALYMEAAQISKTRCDDAPRAIALFGEVVGMADADADANVALRAAHQLNELLAASGDTAARVDVLERLAALESAPVVRRAVLGQVGRLADELDQPDRALAAYNARREADSGDAEALDAIIALLEKRERWEPLCDALRERARSTSVHQQRRADLIRLARIQETQLDKVGEAIDTWLQVREEFGDEAETVSALDSLMATAMRFEELSEIVDDAAATRRLGAAKLLSRLGELHRLHLDDAKEATQCYAQALSVEPHDATALAGQRALLEDETVAGAAAESLASAFRETEQWDALLELVDTRVSEAPDRFVAVDVLREAARLYEQQAGDARAALHAIGRALAADPDAVALEAELMRLGEQCEDWERVASALEESGSLAQSPARAGALFRNEASVRQDHLDDARGAVEALGRAAERQPTALPIQRALIEASARAGDWAAAAKAAMDICRARELLDEDVLIALAQAADVTEDGWTPLLAALDEALADVTGLPTAVARDLYAQVGRWHLDNRDDLSAAETSARNALGFAAGHRPTLEFLADLQRQVPEAAQGDEPPLCGTLLEIDALSDRDLDPLTEAAEVAQAADAAPNFRRQLLARLYRKAARLLAAAEPVLGERQPDAVVTWALEALVAIDAAAGRHEDAIKALVAATQMPLGADAVAQLRLRAARLCKDHGDRPQAIALLQRVLDTREDLELVRETAQLCEEEHRTLAVLQLRQRELDLTTDPARKLELRLRLSQIVGEVEAKSGREQSLQANLAEQPGHPPTIAALTEVLLGRGQADALASVLETQAHTLEGLGQAEAAAKLWSDLARLVQESFADNARAIEALGHVVELAPTVEALDQLARLHLQQDQPAEAAAVLRRRIEYTEAANLVPLMLRLARAEVAAGAEADACKTLQSAFDDAPDNAEVRKLLIKLYRAREQWEPLARTLTVASAHISDHDTLLGYAREASDLYHERLAAPADAVEILERAHAVAHAADNPDRDLQARLAASLRAAGRLDDARALLETLVDGFGRRRSPQRAAAHLELARVAQAQGDTATATDQLELASGMDANNPAILQTLAEAARDAEQHDRAERAYRTLLLQARRRAADEDIGPRSAGDGRIGAAEVLYELSRIARARDDEDQAQELIESAMEALAERPAEGLHFAARLREQGEHALLQRVIEARLNAADTPRARALVLGELADLQAEHLDDPEAALKSRLQALKAAPGDPHNHEKARGLAIATGDPEAYIAATETLLEKARRPTDVYVRCELLLRLAEATQVDRGDADGASALLKTAEELGVREVDVWRAAARIAGARGDTAEQMAYLETLAELGEDATETRADALYRMAEVHLASGDTDEGLRALEDALDMTSRPERACRILARATASEDTPEALLSLYERVARSTGDDRTLLDALERVASHGSAEPESVQEAVELAERLGDSDRAEELMLKAVDVASGTLEGVGRASWALLGLATRRQAAGDIAGAVKWVCEAIEADAELATVRPLAESIAHEGRERGDVTFAVSVYEALHVRDSMSSDVWRPLAGLYRELGDLDRLTRLVEDTVDSLTDADERLGLRLELAQSLLSEGRLDDAIDALRNLLMEDPRHAEAGQLLLDALVRADRHADVIDLLRQRLLAAQGGGEPAEVVAAARALSGHQREHGDSEDAVETLRSALEWAPEDASLLQEVAATLGDGDEHASARVAVLRQLLATQQGDEAAQTALQLARSAEALGDTQGKLDALAEGYARAPGHDGVRTELEQSYEAAGDYRGLAELIIKTAEGTDDSAAKAQLFRRAASIHRELLMDADGGSELLARAREANPDDPGLAMDLAGTLAASGQTAEAHGLICELLERDDLDLSLTHQLICTRADLRRQLGDWAGAVLDLEHAYPADAEGLGPALVDALESLRHSAAQAGDAEVERNATLRIGALSPAHGDVDHAQALLGAWVEGNRKDAEALRMLRDLAVGGEDWAHVAKLSARLVAVESGEAQADAALRLADACTRMGAPGEARPGLEHARRKQPENPQIRDALRSIYEETGAHKELGKILYLEASETQDEDTRVELLRRVATLYLEDADAESATRVLAEVLELAPGDIRASITLADAHLAQGALDTAGEILRAAADSLRTPRGADAAMLFQRLARVAGSQGDTAKQLELLQSAFNADKQNGEVAAELADLAEVLEEWDIAVRVLRTITVLEGECPISRPQAFLRQAQIALHRGDRQRAVLWARKAKHEGPDDPDVDQFLAQLDG